MSVTIKVYAEVNDRDYYTTRLYRTVGEAKKNAYYNDPDVMAFNVIAPDANSAADFDRKMVCVYRWYRRNKLTDECTYQDNNWYVSEDVAAAVAKEFYGSLEDTEKYEYHKAEGYVFLREAYPVKCPKNIILRHGNKGDLCYRGNLRPDLDCRKKNYYIDRSCKANLVEGPAIITSYKDIGHCGFITCEMEQFGYPDCSAIDSWIVKDIDNGDIHRYLPHVKINMKIPGVVEWKNSACGKYVKVTLETSLSSMYGVQHVKVESYLVKSDSGSGIEEKYDLEYVDETATVEASSNISDYLVEGYQNFHTFDEFKDYFTDLNLPKLPRNYSDLNKDAVVPEIVDEAMSTYAIDAHITKGIRFYNVVTRYNTDWFNLLTQYSPDEIKRIHDIIANTNATALKKFQDLHIPLRD